LTCCGDRLYYYDVPGRLTLVESGRNGDVFLGGHLLRVMRWAILTDVLRQRTASPELLMMAKHHPDSFLPQGEL